MDLPLTIQDGLDELIDMRWKRQFVHNNRRTSESVWKRDQVPSNKHQSGWRDSTTDRRKLLHHADTYNVIQKDSSYEFVLESPYLWVQQCIERDLIPPYLNNLQEALETGVWKQTEHDEFSKGDLIMKLTDMERHHKDIEIGKTFPKGYGIIQIMLYSTQTQLPLNLEEKVWLVVREGMRPKQERGTPTIIQDLSEINLDELFPAQVEIGSGPAIEAGVPPLHYWHNTYYLSDPITNQFIFTGPDDQLFQEIAREPETFFIKAAEIYRTSLCLPTTPFYRLLKRIHDDGLIVGDIITNNVDGFVSRVGLQERYVRIYETNSKMPNIKFDPRAKSYLNIGVHADRRLIHQGAREQRIKNVLFGFAGIHAR